MATQIIPPVVPSVKHKTINPERRRRSHGAAWVRNGQFARLAGLRSDARRPAVIIRRPGAGGLRPCDALDKIFAGFVEYRWKRNTEVCGGVDARFLLPAPKVAGLLAAPKVASAALLAAPKAENWVGREVSAFFRLYARPAGIEARKSGGAVDTICIAAKRESGPNTCGENGKSGQFYGGGRDEVAEELGRQAIAAAEEFFTLYAREINRKPRKRTAREVYLDGCKLDTAERNAARLFTSLAVYRGQASV